MNWKALSHHRSPGTRKTLSVLVPAAWTGVCLGNLSGRVAGRDGMNCGAGDRSLLIPQGCSLSDAAAGAGSSPSREYWRGLTSGDSDSRTLEVSPVLISELGKPAREPHVSTGSAVYPAPQWKALPRRPVNGERGPVNAERAGTETRKSLF